jgi:Tol biopolymer transport system component
MRSLLHNLAARAFRAGVASSLALVFAGTLAGPAAAQYFGRNKVQYDQFDFRIIRTPHFEYHFYPEAAGAIEDAARMGERWYERLARAFQHEFAQPKPVILYADHPDFQQTNTLSGALSEGTGGVTESLKNRVIMPLAGSYWDTDHVLGHELVHAFQYNIAQSRQGGGLQSLVRLPLWMIEGMAEYLSVGRDDPLTAMWLRDALRRDDIPSLEQLTKDRRYFPYRFGEAFWAYVGGTYGDDAVIALFRRALRVGVSPAIRQVLGTEADSLSVDWHRAIERDYASLLEGRTPPEQVGTEILSPETGAGRQNLAPSVSPDGRYVAFLSEKDLFSVDLYLADAQTGEIIRKLSSADSDPHSDAIRFIDSSGSWSPDGSRFVFVVFASGGNELIIIETDDADTERRIQVGDIGAITNPSWSPDGRSIVFSGQRGGLTDLFLYDLENDEIRDLTSDRYGDFQPAWSPDGSMIAFSSDRGAETDFDRLTYGKPQISIYHMPTGRIETLDLFGDVKHINPQFAPDGRSLYFVSDPDGFSDIYRYTFAENSIRRVTTVATGVSGITWMAPALSVAREAGTVVFSIFDEREFHIYALDQQTAGTLVSADDFPQPQAGRKLPPVDQTRNPRVASYLDDWETGLVPPGTYSAADSEAYDSQLQLDYVSQPTMGVGADRFGNYVAGGVAFFFSDMLGNRRLGAAIQANGTFKDIGGQVAYQDVGRRWNWGGYGGRIPYQFVSGFWRFREDGLQEVALQRYRIFQDVVNGVVSYPFTTTRRVEFSGGFNRYSWDLEEEVQVLDPFGRVIDIRRESRNDLVPDPLNLFQGYLALVNDYSFFGFTSPIRGGRSRFQIGGSTGTLDYMTAVLDYRRYFNPTRNLTIGFRGYHLGNYGSPIDQSDLRPIPLGFETFIRGYAPESFEARECTAASGEGGTCAEYDRLFGHRIAVFNAEVRVPFLGTEQFGLLNFPYLPTELVAFADVGLAWDGENPAVLRWDRNTADRVPVASAGFSARTNILGFLVLESYYAFPFQRPNKGWHWGFSLAPGW